MNFIETMKMLLYFVFLLFAQLIIDFYFYNKKSFLSDILLKNNTVATDVYYEIKIPNNITYM